MITRKGMRVGEEDVEILLTTDTPDVPNAGKRFALIVK